MTRLNIAGQMVDVDDGFMKLSPEDQDATVQDIGKHLGMQAPSGPQPSGQDVSAIAAAQALPVIGAYAPKAAGYLRHLTRGGTTAENQAQIEADIADYRRQHPIASTVGDVAIGSLPYMAAGEFAGPAKLLGMSGRAATAIPMAAGSGAAIGAADALARGGDPAHGAASGALYGAAGVAGGKALGRVWDAARGMWVDRPRIPNVMDVNGVRVPVRESALTQDPATSAAEQDLLSANVPTAQQAEKDTQAAMEQAHDNVANRLNPGTMGTTAREAGNAAVDDLVSQEQARAEAQVARMAGIAPERASLQRDLGGGIAGPTATADIGEVASGGIRNIFTRMRQATRAAYNAFAAQPATYNPRYLLDVGNTIREALNNAPGDARVRINPATTPQAQAALDTIDQEVAQLRFTNDAARGNRPITPADMDEVRKQLVAHRAQANTLARQTGNWSDARAVGRVMDEFDKWHQATVQRPGGLLTGSPPDVLASLEAAHEAHAAERSRFSRQGPGDVVGTFMERALGKYAGQEMSPEKIAGSILGSPGKAPPENAVPILNHLRDNVFGANSPEWNAIKHGVLSHLTEVPAGAEPLTPLKQAQNIDRFLGNERHANALFDAGEQARIQQHANNLRSVVDEPAAAGSIAEKIRAGKLTGEQLISQLMGNRGSEVAWELLDTAPGSIPAMKEGLYQKVVTKPEGATDWGPQKIANALAKFLDKDVAHTLYTPNELTMLRTIQQAHKALIPVPGTVNFSRTAPTLMRNLAGYIKQFLSMIAFAAAPAHGLAGHLVSGAIGYGAGHVAEQIAARRAAAQAADLFHGRRVPLVRTGAVGPPRVGAIVGHALGPRTRQAPGY